MPPRIHLLAALPFGALALVALLVGCRDNRSDCDCVADGVCCFACGTSDPDCGGGGDGDVDGDVDGDADGDVSCTDFPLSGECDPMTQSCCAPGERCTVMEDPPGSGTPRETCREEVGSGQLGALCWENDEDDCAAGYWCAWLGFVNFCSPFCETAADCPTDLPYMCAEIAAPADMYSVCQPQLTACDPVEGTGCPDGWVCMLTTTGPTRSDTVCLPAGIRGEHELCDDGSGCRAGMGCYDWPDGYMCRRFCEMGTMCGSGACTDYGHATWGVCP